MKRSLRILFFIIGAGCLVFMGKKADVTASEWKSILTGAGFLTLLLQLTVWTAIYALHTTVHRRILKAAPGRPGFLKMYGLTVSALAFNGATPAGMLGGESYRMLELENSCGREKAFSSVVTMALFYVAGHFLLFLTGCMIFFLSGIRTGIPETVLMAALGLVSAAVVFLFVKKHDSGLLLPICSFLRKIPLLRKLLDRASIRTLLAAADEGFIAISKNRKQFFMLYLTEYAARLLQSLEYYIVFRFLKTGITFPGAILVMTLSSFTANLLPVPMQVGTQESGMFLALSWLSISASAGLRADVMIRMTEIICTAVGMLLVLFRNKKDVIEITH